MVSRFFAPAAGIDEDPVTGSAHCVLAPFWAERTGRDHAGRLPGVGAGRHRCACASRATASSSAASAVTVWDGHLRAYGRRAPRRFDLAARRSDSAIGARVGTNAACGGQASSRRRRGRGGRPGGRPGTLPDHSSS